MDPMQNIFPVKVDGVTVIGLKAEYFTPIPAGAEECASDIGTTRAFDGKLPNLTRTERWINYENLVGFDLDRCLWERNARMDIKYVCIGNEEFRNSFAARWTGYMEIRYDGYYDFQMEHYDGARLVIGNNDCPSNRCGTYGELQNMDFNDLWATPIADGAFKRNCPDCASAVWTYCWITDAGCEPFPLWQVESDGARSNTCPNGPNITGARRWLKAGLHPIRLELFQRGGEAKMIFRYKGPDTNGEWMVPVDAVFRYPIFNGFLREFYRIPDDTEWLLDPLRGAPPPGSVFIARDVHSWGNSAPGQSEFSDYVAGLGYSVYVKWEGWFTVYEKGLYNFRIYSDDGARLILGGQGDRRERTVVNNNGLKLGAKEAEGDQELLPGRHFFRVEWYWIYEETDGDLSRPPGISIWWRGPDTLFEEKSFTDQPNRWITSEPTCATKFFKRAGGSYYTKDCRGTCFDDGEPMVGDFLCDDGTVQGTTQTLDLICDPWLDDNGDCANRAPVFVTTTVPRIQCLENPLPGHHKHHDYEGCERDYRGLCSYVNKYPCSPTAEDPLACGFVECCVAKLDYMEYWGTECYAFGVLLGWTCESYLPVLMDQIRNFWYLDPEAQATPGNPGYSRVNGSIMSSCTEDNCNHITDDMVPNPITGLPTLERVCQSAESEYEGMACYEGPWDVIGVRNPFEECYLGQYSNNFCISRKTIRGKPYARCCSFSFQNARRESSCMFYGVPQGADCELWATLYQENVSTNLYTAISNVNVKYDCIGDFCNNPMRESASSTENGCPWIVDTDPEITRAARADKSDKPPTYEEIIAGTVEDHGFQINWAVTLTVFVGTGLFAAMVYGMYKVATDPDILGLGGKVTGGIVMEMSKDPDHGYYHGKKAKVMNQHTFVDVEQDVMFGPGTYHVVKTRNVALRQDIEDDQRLPRALRQDPKTVLPAIRAMAQEEADRMLALEHELTAPLPKKRRVVPRGDFVSERKPFPQAAQPEPVIITPVYTPEELEQMRLEEEERIRAEKEAAEALARVLGDQAPLALPGQPQDGSSSLGDDEDLLGLEDAASLASKSQASAPKKPDSLRPLAGMLGDWDRKYGHTKIQVPRTPLGRTLPPGQGAAEELLGMSAARKQSKRMSSKASQNKRPRGAG